MYSKTAKNIVKEIPSNPYDEGKVTLNAAFVCEPKYREVEEKSIRSFLLRCLQGQQSGSLFVSGAPGTGKTFCVTRIIDSLQDQFSFKSIFVNCMGCRTPTDVFSKVLMAAGFETPKKKKEIEALVNDSIVTPTKSRRKSIPMNVIVLDEVDKLENKNHDVLYTIFQWPRLDSSKVIVIGISNTLDFTTRSLKRLQSLKVDDIDSLHFQPYTKSQVKGILESRLPKLPDGSLLVKDNALEMCARKVASSSGDIRKALHVIRRAVELVEAEVKSSYVLKTTADDGSNVPSPRKKRLIDSISLDNITPVGAQHVSKVLNEVYAPKALEISGTSCMSSQQQLALCSLLLLVKFSGQKEIPVSKCQTVFSRISNRKSLGGGVESSSEFLGMCQLLESKGFVTLKKDKKTSITKISLNVAEEEIEGVMTDKSLLRSIISDDSFIRG